MQDLIKKFLIFLIPLVFISVMLRFLVFLPKKFNEIKKQEKVKITKKENIEDKKQEETYVKRSLTVVIDPLNGGSNKGSINDDGISESHLNLEFAFKLSKHLRMKGIRAYLTRFGDKDTSLEDRFKTALKYTPNLYISISCIYIDDLNYSDKINVASFDPFSKDLDIELQENSFYDFYEGEYLEKTDDAKYVEERIYNEIRKVFGLKKESLERAFLKQSSIKDNIPSISVFISNFAKDDVRKFAKPKMMEDIAENLATAIFNGLSLKLK